MASTTSSILSSLRNTQSAINWQQLLSDIISSFGCSTGTIHIFDDESKLLKLQAQQGIPPSLLPKMMEIPIGKGMAGIAAERQQPVELCNLQTDDSGVARPSAKETKVEGSIAVPMLLDGSLYGVFGIAKPIPYDFTAEEEVILMEIGEEMSRYLRAQASLGKY